MEFVDNHKDAFNTQDKLSKARYYQKYDTIQQNALLIFTLDWAKLDKIKLYLKGTEFQMKVWETLLKIPMGGRTTYGDITAHIGNPHARHAVGTAVGENPVTFLIPCHRVVRATREIGNYHWGGKSARHPLSVGRLLKKKVTQKNE